MFKIVNGVLTEYKREKGETNVIVPDNVKVIGKGVFSNCRTIKSVEIPGNVLKIEASAFKKCSSLERVLLSEQLTNIGDKAFYACVNLKEVVFPSTISNIGSRAFYGCKQIEKIDFPDNLVEIGDEAFKVCVLLKTVNFGDGIKKIGRQAFANTGWLEKKRKENPIVTVKNIIIDAYKCKNIIQIPANVLIASEGAFSGNNSISGLVLTSDNHKIQMKIGSGKEVEDIFRIINASEDLQKNLLQQIKNEDLKTQIAIFLAFGKRSMVGQQYLSDNIMQSIKCLIKSNDIVNLKSILKENHITDNNISELISYSIEYERFEIETLLLEYKNETIGLQNVHDRFKL